MNYLTCLIYIAVFVQITTAQILSHGLQNKINQQPRNLVQLNSASNANIAKSSSYNIASTGLNLNKLVDNSLTRANNQAANLQAASLQTANLQATNLQASNLQAANIQALNNRFGNINNANLATQNGLANAKNEAVQNRYANVGIGGNFANGFTNGNLGGYNLGNVVNDGVSTVNGKLNPQAFGISIVADALEVGGRLAVNGRVPFYGGVAVNSQIPTEGSATVSYSCGRPTGY